MRSNSKFHDKLKEWPEEEPKQLSLLDMAQPLLPASLRDPDEFAAELAGLVGSPVRIILTPNRASLISVREDRDGIRTARIQQAFRAADRETMKALARFLMKPDKRCRARIDGFLRLNQDLIEIVARDGAPARRAVTRGHNRDLKVVLRKVMRERGLRLPGVTISWSNRGARKRGRRRTIKFGSYCHKTRVIKIHPALDSADVPDYFVEYIVYHELLHALFPPSAGPDGRRDVHTREFKRFEKKFPRYQDAIAFERLFVNTRLK